jgi:S-DNA-T family DNA segregation ATPase FtsK/SpoIIIE
MSQPLCERLRQALREFKNIAAARARQELEAEAGFRERSQVLEREFHDHVKRIDQAFHEGMAAAEEEVKSARADILSRFEGDEARARQEFEKAKRTGLQNYARGKDHVEADFKESRWTITTVYDAGRKVAKDQFAAAQGRAKAAVERLQEQQQQALQLLQQWQFANDLTLIASPGSMANEGDLWAALEECANQGTAFLARLVALKLPGHVRGFRPFLVIGLVWLVASLPALLLKDWDIVFWLAATGAVVPPFGLLIRWWLKVRARTQAVYLWSGLSQAVVDAKHLRQRCLELAKEAYREQKNDNKRRNEEAMEQAATNTKKTIGQLRHDRGQKIRQAQATFDPLLKKLTERRDRDLREAESAFEEKQADLAAYRDRQRSEVTDRYRKLRDDVNRRHADDWTRLVGQWKQGCARFLSESRAVDEEARCWFPPWKDPIWQNWRLPTKVPLGLQVGKLEIRLEDVPHGVPPDGALQRPDLSSINFPMLLSFPERASLLFKCQDEGKAVAVRSLQALLMRAWTALPAGKARCTIIDPVGRGENFSAFMHLADHEESLVNGRIWTEAAHIDQRLTDLTMHMENVLQKYLRNQYETLAEYNAQAGEVAEPYRFLVVADLPVNFTPDAARRLISLASAGARCGIYTFIMTDLKMPLPQGIDLADIERACTTLAWKNDRYVWNDPDFGSFPLQLEVPPAAEACTSLLRIAGEEAKKAGRVEVPFELIAVPREEWWQGDSRYGLSVPLGRAGATARQFLNLGQGTSQHVLIAGKTGSGKSTLLHVLVAQLAMRYSPSEVELYLIDFKKGVEFKTYASHELPHARVVAVESEREFGLSVLQRLDAELVGRGELFRSVGVNDLPSYRNLPEPSSGNGKLHAGALPRLVLVVDEFQEFFVEDDKLSQEAALLLDRLVRQGRAFGIHVLLGSQTLGGAYSLARSTIDQMAIRIALQCSETDAHLILSKDNSDARLLSRPGEAIYNASGGLLEGNHLFQIVWLSDDRRDNCLSDMRRFAQERNVRTSQIVFEGTAPSDVAKNPLLAQALEQPVVSAAGAPVQVWLGEAVAIKDPTAAIFRRQSGSNLIMIGQQGELAFGMTVVALAALSTQLPAADNGASGLNLVIANPLEGKALAVQNLLPKVLPVRLVSQRELAATLQRLAEEIERRLKEGGDGPPQFLFLHGLQRLRDLRRPEDDFGFSRKGETTVSPFKQFMNVVREGPPLGVFTVLWCDTMANLQRTFDRQGLREFEMRVLFQMSPTDSSTLMDTPLAAKLGMHRALFYTEDQGRLEKFRPYGLPSLDWLRKASRKMQPVSDP